MILKILIALLAVFFGYFALRKLLPPLISLFDRANRNNRLSLSTSYEIPKYYMANPDGSINTGRKWPGWDGWYFLALLDTQNPAQIIRGSVMTGLYGIEGIDNYDKLLLHLSSTNVVECLFMLPQTGITLQFHEYMPKDSYLNMRTDRLEVKVTGLGEVTGNWPVYSFKMADPQDELELSLCYTARDIIWWADIPGVFTYFTTFGCTEGELKKKGEVLQKISSMGSFEHGYAKKCFGYDLPFLPIRLGKLLFPFNVMHYHYDLLFTKEGMHGGIMLAKGFGIKVRNRGGVYLPQGEYIPVKKIKSIKYEKPKLIDIDCTASPVTFYDEWHVEAETGKGLLRYTAKKVHPPAQVAKHMVYHSFLFEGSLGNQPLSGTGYGEYACM
ncbi:MAG TPA: hypothetical protein ACFYD3_02380 [Candidatus Hypogeohydataceae bacterium YC41]